MPRSSRRSRLSSKPTPDKGVGEEPEPEGYSRKRLMRWSRLYPLAVIREAVTSARVQNWMENDDFGQDYFRALSRYGEIGTEGASLNRLHKILLEMLEHWDPEAQEMTCQKAEQEMDTEFTNALKGSYRARRVT